MDYNKKWYKCLQTVTNRWIEYPNRNVIVVHVYVTQRTTTRAKTRAKRWDGQSDQRGWCFLWFFFLREIPVICSTLDHHFPVYSQCHAFLEWQSYVEHTGKSQRLLYFKKYRCKKIFKPKFFISSFPRFYRTNLIICLNLFDFFIH